MNENDFEKRLEQIPLGHPTPALRDRVLREAQLLRQRLRRGRLFKRVVVGLAVALIAVNLFFEHIHSYRVSALVGGSHSTERAMAKAAPRGDILKMRAQLMNELARLNGI